MAVVASAPGKVLITGGYLLLERPNPGLVLSTTSRFYAIVRPLYEEAKSDTWAWTWTDVKVISPQLGREATYKLSMKNSLLNITSGRETSNPFVEQTVQFAVAAAKAKFVDEATDESLKRLLLLGLEITILGCNDFYSYRNQIVAQGLPLTSEALDSLLPFSSISFNNQVSSIAATEIVSKPEVAKTGLGSSAAMTTAVTASLLHYLGVVDLSLLSKYKGSETENSNLDTVHTVAQTAHCVAQGKVGSGFDVSSAVYGSQRYVRFSPGILSAAQVNLDASALQKVMEDILERKWDHEKTKFCLPPLMALILGEPGSGGSSTPSMVGAVKKWKQSDPEKSTHIWGRLTDANAGLEKQLRQLNGHADNQWEVYKNILSRCSMATSDKWLEKAANSNEEEIVRTLMGARNTMLEIRCLMQQMGKEAGVPIEPEAQTKLLDHTMNLEGVLLAGVPGAGGYDAIFAVTLGESARTHVAEAWTSLGVLPMLVREDSQGVCLETGDPREKEISTRIATICIS